MSENNFQEVIKNNKLFDGIPPRELKFSFNNEQILKKKEGEIIFQRGDESKCAYLILAGKVKIKVYIENKSVKLNKTEKDFFGDIEVLEDTYRRSAAVANTDCILYFLSKSDLRTFLAEIPIINDNIIAYNKVDIPELHITIHPDLLKKDTDKIYIDSQTENIPETGSSETAEKTDEPADEIFEVEKIEPDHKVNEVIEEETSVVNDETLQVNKSDDLITPEIKTEPAEPQEHVEVAVQETKEETVEEITPPEETPVNDLNEENYPETRTEEPADEIVEEEKTEPDKKVNEDVEEETSKVKDEPLQVSEPDNLTISGFNTEPDGPQEEQGNILANEKEKETIEEITLTEETQVNDLNEEISRAEEIHSDEKIADEATIPVENETADIVRNEPDKIEENSEEKKDVSDPSTKISAETSIEEQENNEETTWLNLTTNQTEIEASQEISEEEKEKIEAEEEKLKYDDTELNTSKILGAISKINSSLNEQIVHSNIIRETVMLTEAQAGVLYLIDNVKNLLITEMETEDGVIEVSYPLGNGLTGLAAETGEIINVRDPIKDFRFSEDVDSIRGIVGSSLLCVPVLNDDREAIAVICMANSSSGKFLISDEETMASLVPHISQTLQNLANIRKLIEENKNIHLSTLTKFVTENIQTPVLTMKYYAAQIKKKNVPADVKTVLNVLMDQADSVVNFLYSSLAFTEDINALQIEGTDLKEVIDNTLGLLAEYVESRNVTLYKKVEGAIKIKVDKKAFYQACLQIAKNACDAMGESGNIYITARQTGDLINIEFRDTGPGIADEIKTQIFQPFKSFNKENSSGLGLALAQKIIRDHGGELTVESKPGEGATFIISLPSFE